MPNELPDKVHTISTNPGQFLADTQHLSTAAFGAYVMICFSIVTLGQDEDPPSLPDDDELLANITRLPMKDWRRVKQRLCEGSMAVLVAKGGRISQARVVEEIAAARKRIDDARAGGLASAEKRKRKREILAEQLEQNQAAKSQPHGNGSSNPSSNGSSTTVRTGAPTSKSTSEATTEATSKSTRSSTSGSTSKSTTKNSELNTKNQESIQASRSSFARAPAPAREGQGTRGDAGDTETELSGTRAMDFIRAGIELLVPGFEQPDDIELSVTMRDYFSDPYVIVAIAAESHAGITKTPRWHYLKRIIARYYAEGKVKDGVLVEAEANAREYVTSYVIPSRIKRRRAEGANGNGQPLDQVLRDLGMSETEGLA